MARDETFRFSVSQAELFHNCPKKWEYSYARDLPNPPTHYILAFGSAFHTMAEYFFKINYKSEESFAGGSENLGAWGRCWFIDTLGFPENLSYKPENAGFSPYSNGLIEGLTTSKTKRYPRGVLFYGSDREKVMQKIWYLYHRGKKILSKFHKRSLASKNEGQWLGLEVPFRFALDDFIVRGQIDRIDKGRNGRRFRLIDYKTGAMAGEPYIEEELSEGLMVSVYTLALMRSANEKIEQFRIHSPEEVELSIYLPDEEDDSKCYLNYHRTSEDLSKTEKEIIRIRNAIKRGRFKRNVTHSCKFCEFFKTCNSEREQIVVYDGSDNLSGVKSELPKPKKPKPIKRPKQLSLFGILEGAAVS